MPKMHSNATAFGARHCAPGQGAGAPNGVDPSPKTARLPPSAEARRPVLRGRQPVASPATVPRRSARRRALAAAVAVATAAAVLLALAAPSMLDSHHAAGAFSPEDVLTLDPAATADYVPHVWTLTGAIAVDGLVLGNDTYAIVAANGHNAVQLVQIHDNGTLSPGDTTAGKYAFAHTVFRPIDVDAFEMGNDTYAIVASSAGNSVQLLQVHDNGTLEAKDSVANGTTSFGVQSVCMSSMGGSLPTCASNARGFDALSSPRGVDAFKIGNDTYAIATSIGDHGIQLIRVHDNGTLEAAGSAFDGTRGLALSFPNGVVAFGLGDETYAAVASRGSGAVQLVRIHGNGTLEAADAAFNGTRGFDALSGPQDIDAFEMDDKTYVIATSTVESAVQLIRVHGNGTMSAAGSARDEVGGFDELYGALRVDAFEMDGRTYAAVASYTDDGVQTILIHGDGTLSPAGSVTDGLDGFDRLDSASGVVVVDTENHKYAVATSYSRDGSLQLIRVGPPSPLFVTGVSSTAGGGPHGIGRAIDITVDFSGAVSVEGIPNLFLNTGYPARYTGGDGTDKLEFSYTVRPGDGIDPTAAAPPPAPAWRPDTGGALLEYDGIYALSGGGGGTITGASGDGVRPNLLLPLPGSDGSLGASGGVVVDGVAPFVLRVLPLADDGVYGRGSTIEIRVEFSEAVTVAGGAPVLWLDTGAAAVYAGGSGTDALAFNYTVREVDSSPGLQYANVSALATGGAAIADGVGNTADLRLPEMHSGLSLGGSRAIVIAGGAAPRTANALAMDAAGSAKDGAADGLDALGGARAAANLTMGNAVYAVVASYRDDAVQLVRIYGNGTLGPAASAADGAADGLDALGGASGIDAFAMGGVGYAIVASHRDDAVQLLRVRENALEAAASAADGPGFKLDGAHDVAAFELDDGMHALVASRDGDAVQLLRVRENALEAAGSAADGPEFKLDGAHAVDAFELGGATHALVASFMGDAVQLIRVHGNGTLEAAGSATDGRAGFDALDGASGVAALHIGDIAYALAASYHDDAVQLIRIYGNGTLEAAGSATDGRAGFDALDGASDVAVFRAGGDDDIAYALVASYHDDAVQLIRVHGNGTLEAAGSAVDGAAGGALGALDGALGVGYLELGGRAHALVASYHDDAVQLIELGSAPQVARIGTSAGDGAYGIRDSIDVSIAFSAVVDVDGPIELRLSNGATAEYVSGTGTDTLVFQYTVRQGDAASDDLDYAGAGALSGGGTVRGTLGADADLGLPAPGSPGSLGALRYMRIDAERPRVVSVSPLSADGWHARGSTIEIAVEFSEAVTVAGGAPVLWLDTGAAAVYAGGLGADTLVFDYTVQEGDSSSRRLQYAGTSALAAGGAAIADGAGNAARLTLPEPGGESSLGGSGSIAVVDAVQPRADAPLMAAAGSVTGGWLADPPMHDCSLADAGSAAGGASGFCLWGARDAEVFDLDGAKYALVAALRNDTVQLVRIHENGTMVPTATASQGRDGFTRIDGPFYIDVFEDDGKTYALVASLHRPGAGLQLINVSDGNTLVPLHAISGRGFSDVESFVLDGETHALVAAERTSQINSIKLYRVDPDAPNTNDRIRVVNEVFDNENRPGYLLTRPLSVDVFTMNGGDTYAVVASSGDDAVQLIRIYDNGTLEAADTAVDDGLLLPARNEAGDGYFALDTVRFVDAFALRGDRMYAIASSNMDDGVQLIRIHGNGTLSPAGYARNGVDGFMLDHPNDVDAFTIGGDTYVLVASERNTAAQLIRVHEDGALEAVGSAVNGSAGFDALSRPSSISVFEMAGDVHAAVASFRDFEPPGNDGVQLIRFWPPPPNATRVDFAPGAAGTYAAAGDTVDIVVGFSENVTVLRQPQQPPPMLLMSTGHAAPYLQGNNTDELTFRYTVQPGDDSAADGLDYAGTGALSAGGGSRIVGLDGGMRVDVSLVLPPPGQLGAADVRADGTPPRVLGVTARDMAYMEGASIAVRVNFDEPVVFSGGMTPSLELDVGGESRTARYTGGNGTASLTFAYTVGSGDPAAARLGYSGTNSLDAGGGLADAAGNQADPTLPFPGSPSSLGASNARIDKEAPSVQGVESALPDGAYGSAVVVRVVFSEPVFVSGGPRLVLSADPPLAASYRGGNGTAELLFRHAVLEGTPAISLDAAAPLLALDGGSSIADGAGNTADLGMPPDPQGGFGSFAYWSRIGVDGVAPDVERVYSPDGGGAWHARGDRVDIRVVFSEPVFVSGGPRLGLDAGGAGPLGAGIPGSGAVGSALYAGGSGTAELEFAYTVREGDAADPLEYAGPAALSTGADGSIRDAAGNPAELGLPEPGSLGRIDGTVPYVLAVSSPDRHGAYGAGASIDITVEFSEPVLVEGTPRLALNTIPPASADYISGNGSGTLTFRYMVLDGHGADLLGHADSGDGGSALSAEGSGVSIRDEAGNDANLDLPARGLEREGIAVDAIAPRITGARATSLDTILVAFDEPVAYAGGAVGAAGWSITGAGLSVSPSSAASALSDVLELSLGGRLPNTAPDIALSYDADAGGIADRAGNALPSNGSIAVADGIGPAIDYSRIVDDGRIKIRYTEPVSAPMDAYSVLILAGTGRDITSVDGNDGSGAVHVLVFDPPGVAQGSTGTVTINRTLVRDRADQPNSMGTGVLERQISDGRVLQVELSEITGSDTAVVGYTRPAPAQLDHYADLVVDGTSRDITSLDGGEGDGTDEHTLTFTPGLAPPDATGSVTIRGAVFGGGDDRTQPLADGQDPEVRSATAVTRTAIQVVLSEPVVVSEGGTGAALGWSVSGRGAEGLVVLNASDDLRSAPAAVLTLTFNGEMPGGTAPTGLTLRYNPSLGSVEDPAGNSLASSPTGIDDGIAPEVESSLITGPNEAEISYTEPVRALSGAYESVILADGSGPRPVAEPVGGNGNRTHTISFGGDAAVPGIEGTLRMDEAAVVDEAGNRLGPGPTTLHLRDERGPAGLERAAFTAPNTVTIEYSYALGPPDGHGDLPVYASASVDGEDDTRDVARVGGLGTAVHTVVFGGPGVDRNQTGTVELAVNLTGTAAAAAAAGAGGMPLRFEAGPIDVAAGRTVHAVVLRPDQPNRTVAIEPDGFTRTVDATAAGPGARPAVDVTGLAARSGPGSGPLDVVRFPAEPVTLAAEFATAVFPANSTAVPAPPGGVIFLRALSDDERPPLAAVAAALGYDGADGLDLGTVVEAAAAAAGSSETTITFNRPVRILLEDQSGGRAFYVNGSAAAAAAAAAAAGAAIAPIDIVCRSDDADGVHGQLGGAGECYLDMPGGNASSGKAIYTYHLTLFGVVRADAVDPTPPVDPADRPKPSSVSVLRRAGGDPLRAPASYTAGQDIAVQVRFTAPVDVDTSGGVPYIELRTGSAGARAGYVSGSGTDRIEFSYAVRGGDIADRLSYAGAGALRLGGGAITAAAAAGSSLAASVALPEPGASGSLSAPDSPAVRIDPEPGRPVLDVGILDDGDGGAGGGGGGIREAALAAAYAFNERQGRTVDALLVNATAYDAGGATAAAAAAEALRAAHAGGSGPSVYVGPSTDRGLHAAMPYAAEHGIILVSAGSTAPSLAVEDDTAFRFLPGGRLDAEALARLARTAGAESMVAVLENATHGPPTADGTSLGDATPPPQDRFSRAFDAALAYAGVPTLSDTIALEGGAAGGGGGPYEAAAAAEALDAAVQAARFTPVAVVYTGSPDGLAALAAASASYPALTSAAWIASGQSANSSLLVGDGPAAAFAVQAGLEAVRWSVPASDLSRAVDSLLAPGAADADADSGARHRAYAAYDAMTVIGTAAAAAAAADTRGDTPDAAAVAGLIPATAAAYDGALGDIALNNAGDLWVPAVYDLWTVERPGADPEWTLQEGALDETRACSITLTRAKIDYGPIDSGQTSRPHLQTIVNTGQLSFSRVDLTTTPWHVDSPGNCEPGDTPSLPVGLSEIRTEQGGAFSDLAGTGTVLAQGLEAGSRSPLWYRLSLAGYADLPQAEITQCATYVVRCG